MKLYVECPTDHPELHNQTELSDMSDKEFMSLFEPLHPSIPIRIYRFLCFILFFGPFKMLFCVLFFFIYFVVVTILPIFRPRFKTNRDFKGWAFGVCKPIVRMAIFFMGIVRIDVKGEPHPDTRTYVANHLSLVETLLILHQFPICYLAAAYLKNSTFVLHHEKVFDLVFVDRSKHQNISQQIQDIQNDPMLLPVVVFPEGKVTNGEALVGFRSGAYLSPTLVQPIAIRYKMWLTHPQMSTVAWNEDNIPLYLYQMFAIPFMTVELNVLTPINWKGSDKTANEKAAESELQIANALGTLACSRTNKDLFKHGDMTNFSGKKEE